MYFLGKDELHFCLLLSIFASLSFWEALDLKIAKHVKALRSVVEGALLIRAHMKVKGLKILINIEFKDEINIYKFKGIND